MTGYEKKCYSKYGDNCFFCKDEKANIIHFIDGDRSNTDIENIRPSCSSCYASIHDSSPKYMEWSLKLSNSPVPSLSETNLREAFSRTPYKGSTVTELSDEVNIAKSHLEKILDAKQAFESQDVSTEDYVWYMHDNQENTNENVILFPDRREIAVSNASEDITNKLGRISHMVDISDDGSLYRIDEEDVWNATHDSIDDYINDLEAVINDITPRLKERIESDWNKSTQFELKTSEKGNTILEANDSEVFENVAKRKLNFNEHYTKFIDDKTLRVTNNKESDIKQKLYDSGYPVQDYRELEDGENIDIEMSDELQLRGYQQTWVDKFLERGGGTFVGPPGSGKTVAAIGVITALGGETLIIVPKRELAQQWEDELVANTTLTHNQIGQYHGGKKEIAPVTIATYDIARQSRHRKLFNDRDWHLSVYDECFSKDTVIETPNESKTFEDIDVENNLNEGWNNIRMKVKTFDFQTGEFTWDDVNKIYKRKSASLQKVKTEKDYELKVTPSHTHMVFDEKTDNIKQTKNLSIGDLLIKPQKGVKLDNISVDDEEVVRVKSIDEIESGTVYDFETESHKFIADGFYTHNCHHMPSPVWKRVSNIQSKARLGLTATPVRESGSSKEIYSLIGPPVGTDWHALFEDGYVQKPNVNIKHVEWFNSAEREKYQKAKGHAKRQISAMNPQKLTEIKKILSKNQNKNSIIFVEWLDQGKEYSDKLDIPFICGETPHKQREKYFGEMKSGERSTLIISRVGDEGIDIPNADMCIIASTLGSSKAQTAQRIGRTMRPVGASEGYLLATKGSNEEDFIRSSTKYLAQQGIKVHIQN